MPSRGSPAAAVRHVAWAGAASAGHFLEIPAVLADCLGIPDGAVAGVTVQTNVPAAVSVTVEPASSDDWEIVELHADYMEEQLLNQVSTG